MTATALQKLQYSNILLLAANEGISEEIKAYANNILQMLIQIREFVMRSSIMPSKCPCRDLSIIKSS